MTVYLGSAGHIELTRTSLGVVASAEVRPSDINTKLDRFSFDYPNGSLLTGDLLSLSTVDGGPLRFVSADGWDDGQVHRDGKFFANVDETGGLRLYKDFSSALEGSRDELVELADISNPITINYVVENILPRCLGEVTGWELNTNRETVDVTALGDAYREVYSGLISGEGQISALFQYTSQICNPQYNNNASPDLVEMPIYLYHLLQRQQLGSTFKASFYVISRGAGEKSSDEIWYEVTGVLTNCAVAIEPASVIRSQFQFVTTGPIQLRTRFNTNYIVQEHDGASRIALERLQGNYFLETEQET